MRSPVRRRRFTRTDIRLRGCRRAPRSSGAPSRAARNDPELKYSLPDVSYNLALFVSGPAAGARRHRRPAVVHDARDPAGVSAAGVQPRPNADQRHAQPKQRGLAEPKPCLAWVRLLSTGQKRGPTPRQRIYLVVAFRAPSAPVSDRKTFGGVSQFAFSPFSCDCKRLILKGEMSEWLKKHAWKAIRATLIER
jgi:hypothetical protein